MAKKIVKAAVLGAAGRMGMRIIDRIAQAKGIILAGAVERRGHPLLGQDVESFTGIKGLKIILQEEIGRAHV
jgi:4-hydroxy-tetrahydrodipicolinate reductase